MLEYFAFAFFNLLGLISPGPDFAIVTHYGMKGSRKAAFLVSLGITTAVLVHVLYCILGIAIFLQNSPLLFHGLQLVGAGYLGYVGLQILCPKNETVLGEKKAVSCGAFRTGFLTNLLNPKATLFFLSLFSRP
jgi:threonine/homoserine/homoserine lactone efflux protein